MLSWEYPPRIIGGLARVVWALSRELVKTGCEVHVVTADHPGQAEHEIADGVHIHRVKTQTDTTPDFITWVNRLNFGMLQYAIQIHRKTPFDIVHAHDWMVTDAAWVMKSGFGIPFVATMHATEAGRMHGIHNEMQRYIHQMEWRLTFEAWEVIVNSNSMQEELRHSFNMPSDKTVIIPNGTNPEVFDFEFDGRHMRSSYAREQEQIVLFVGRMVREKGVQVLLDAARVFFRSDRVRNSYWSAPATISKTSKNRPGRWALAKMCISSAMLAIPNSCSSTKLPTPYAYPVCMSLSASLL